MGFNQILSSLLVFSVLYQALHLANYRQVYHTSKQEARLLHVQYVTGVKDAIAPQLQAGEAADNSIGARGVRRAHSKRPKKTGATGAFSRSKGTPASFASSGPGHDGAGLREHKNLQQPSHHMSWLPTSSSQGHRLGSISVETISADEAKQMADAAKAKLESEKFRKEGAQGGGTDEAEEEVEEDAGEIQGSDPRARPITLGGEAKWEHKMSGVPGGIGRPKVYNVEPLYLVDNHHFILHQKQFETDGTRGGWIANNGKPRSAILRYPIMMADGTKSYDQTQFLADLLDLLPYNDTKWQFGTCAIVSNSGSLLNSEFGAEIDSHDVVIRINHAPVLGFRRYVGIKTTFDICNRPHANRLSKLSVLRKHQKSSLVVFESLNWNVYYRLYKHLFKAFPFPGTVVLSPDLMIATMELWKKLASKFPKYAYSCSAIKRAASQGDGNKRCQVMKHDCDSTICKPSSGFFALVFASQMCNQVSMYGFEAYRFNSKMEKSTKYHYFDDETGTTNVHSFVLLMKVFKYLSEYYPIKLRTSEQGQLDVDAEETRRALLGGESLTLAPNATSGRHGD